MPSGKITVSVIIPTYNRAEYLAQAVQSVVGQKLNKNQRLEIIVVDDGSIDNTEKVVKKFGKKVTYIKIPHAGYPARPRNVGMQNSSGEFIAFLDSDDIWLPNKLATQLPHFKDSSVALVYSNAEVIDENGKRTGDLVVSPAQLKNGYVFKDLLLTNFISTLTVVVRRSAIHHIGVFNENDQLRTVEDYELWLRLASYKSGKVKAIKKTLALYRRHSQSISRSSTSVAIERIYSVFEQVWSYHDRLNKSYVVPLVEAMVRAQSSWSSAKAREEPYSNPTISVVMSVYNGSRHLRQAISSILNQTFKDIEFIIIDDGSTDDTADIVRSFDDPRIRLIQQQNKGLVESLNIGVQLARSSIIARMDADDISLPSRLEKELRLILSNPRLGLVGSFFSYIDEKNDGLPVTITSPTKSIDLKRSLYLVNPIGHGTAMFKKAVFDQAGGYRDNYGPTEDYDLWRRMSDSCELGVVPESLYLYRLSPDGITHTKNAIQHKYTAKIVREQWEKPFVLKSPKDILADAKYYQNFDSPYAKAIYNQYRQEQYMIALEMLARGWAKSGLLATLAVWRLDHNRWHQLWRPLLGGVLRKLGIRKRKR